MGWEAWKREPGRRVPTSLALYYFLLEESDMDADLSATPARDARPRRMRGQFSLRGLLLGLTLVTLLLSHVYTSWQLYRARAENSRLRTEVGELEIEDPDQLNVVTLSTIENMTWKWRRGRTMAGNTDWTFD